MLLEPQSETRINQLILEYLVCGKYTTTLQAFQNEASKMSLLDVTATTSTGASKWLQDALERFETLFSAGDQSLFFLLWDEMFPLNERINDLLLRQLEFMLGVYFAVYPLLPNTLNPKAYKIESTMDAFKKFIETRGADQGGTSQFLQYYALPYVPDPQGHPSFQNLFLDTWAPELHNRLVSFLKTSLTKKQVPQLVNLLNESHLNQRGHPQCNHNVDTLNMNIQELENYSEHINIKLRNIQMDYQSLIAITSDLVQTLASSISGEKIKPAYLSAIVQKLSTFKKEDHSNGLHQSHINSSKQISESDSHSPRHSQSSGRIQHSAIYPARLKDTQSNDPKLIPIEKRLDYSAIQNTLLSNSNDANVLQKQAFLLQALRLRLSKSQSCASRREVLHSFIAHDLLDIRKGKGVIADIFGRQSLIVKEQLAQLINTIATDWSGREYLLLKNGHLVSTLLEEMKSRVEDSEYRRNLLGALQKLSLRRVAQSIMNKSCTISYLQSILKDIDSLSEYTIEYATALMMNLCLRKLGKQQCAASPEQTLLVLNSLIEHDNIQVKTYVNGTIYSILSEPAVKDRALAIGMDEQLGYLREISEEQLVKQIDFVIMKLQSKEDEKVDEDTVSEDGEEDDNIDEEDDLPVFDEEEVNEIAPGDAETLIGDELLESYAISKPSISSMSRADKSRIAHTGVHTVADFKRAMTPSRPSTPGMGRREGANILMNQPNQTNSNPTNTGQPIAFRGKADFDVGFSTRPKLHRTPIPQLTGECTQFGTANNKALQAVSSKIANSSVFGASRPNSSAHIVRASSRLSQF
ncbi:LisH domain-containing protein armc9 [Batrachochytrium dendrobatidis]|nr:LisH domain-containing protein armc9 [Batrachochytrium dendrobatidis]